MRPPSAGIEDYLKALNKKPEEKKIEMIDTNLLTWLRDPKTPGLEWAKAIIRIAEECNTKAEVLAMLNKSIKVPKDPKDYKYVTHNTPAPAIPQTPQPWLKDNKETVKDPFAI